MADIKNFLYAWCGKKKLTPSYDIRAAGNKNRQKFMCEVRVDGFNYIGMGNSTNKKDAQTNAARDFVNYLVRVGEINAAEVPAIGVGPPAGDQLDGGVGGDGGFGNLPPSGPLPPHLVVKEEQGETGVSGPVPGVTGLGYSGGGGAEWERGANLKEYYARRDEQEAQATLESEEVDLNANLHGNWTLENAKARLNQFFQKEKTSAEYKYSQVGPDHNRSFIAEMQLFVRQLGRKITAREHESNKKLATQSCVLSVVRQLYHLGVIEPYSGVTKKKEGETVPAAVGPTLDTPALDSGVKMTAVDILDVLEELNQEEFEKFKWFLQQPEILSGLPTVKRKRLEGAKTLDIVDLMVQIYTLERCMEVTCKILGKCNRNDLRTRLLGYRNSVNVMCLQHDKPLELFCRTNQTCVCLVCSVSDHKNHEFVPLREESEGKKAELRKTEAEVQEMIQERRLKIQEIRESVKISRDAADREEAEGVQVFTALIESAKRGLKELLKEIQDKQETAEKQAEDFIRDLEQEISELKKRSSEVKQLSQDDDPLHLLQSFSSLKAAPPTKTWTEVRVHPPYYEGTVVRAVAQIDLNLREKMKKLLEVELKRIQQFAVDVTLDPDAAHPKLILSDDGKQVKHGDVRKNLPDYPERFSLFSTVLGRQSFSSGRFYFEFQVKGKTDWTLGVARESVDRKEDISLCPQNGFWTIWLRNRYEYIAFAGPPVRLHLHPGPEKVGVFVDYDQGLVSFYDVDAAALIYCFTGCCFKEKLYPFFSPESNDGGKNSAPLIICPVGR